MGKVESWGSGVQTGQLEAVISVHQLSVLSVRPEKGQWFEIPLGLRMALARGIMGSEDWCDQKRIVTGVWLTRRQNSYWGAEMA